MERKSGCWMGLLLGVGLSSGVAFAQTQVGVRGSIAPSISGLSVTLLGGELTGDVPMGENLLVGGDIAYGSASAGAYLSQIKIGLMQVAGHGKYLLRSGGPLTPYVGGGVGMYTLSVSSTRAANSMFAGDDMGIGYSESFMGFKGIGGVLYDIGGGTQISGETRIHMLFTGASTMIFDLAAGVGRSF